MALKRALISGVTGQIGSHLADLLLEKGYEVHGIVRRTSTPAKVRRPEVKLHSADLCDQSSLSEVVRVVQPDEVYNLAAQSFVPTSWQQPALTGDTTGLGVARMLEAVRHNCPGARFYQASSSECYGKVRESPQHEGTSFYPRSPYGAAKCYGHWITVNARESYGLHASSGICFNCEGPRRGVEFVTRRITTAVAAIKKGKQETLVLGNLDARRDWGFAGDYVQAMHLILQQPKPDDYVIATGVSHSVGQFCEAAFAHVGLDWRRHVVSDPTLYRPAEVDVLLGDARKLRALGWKPEVDFESLVKMMVDADMEMP